MDMWRCHPDEASGVRLAVRGRDVDDLSHGGVAAVDECILLEDGNNFLCHRLLAGLELGSQGYGLIILRKRGLYAIGKV
jgi:hypothetical protein